MSDKHTLAELLADMRAVFDADMCRAVDEFVARQLVVDLTRAVSQDISKQEVAQLLARFHAARLADIIDAPIVGRLQ
jgi:hypothetical protein